MTRAPSLTSLRHDMGEANVLSVYLPFSDADPAERDAWQTQMRQALTRAEPAVDEDRAQFVAARGQLENALAGLERRHSYALAVFATASRRVETLELAAPVETLARWRRGPFLSPLLRSLKQQRPVVVVIADRRRARVFRYALGTLIEQVDFRADEFIDDLTDRNMSKRAATHSGVRGETATDAADRILRLAAMHLLRHVSHVIATAPADALIIVGGPTATAATLAKLLPPAVQQRWAVDEGLHLLMSAAQVQESIEVSASALTRRLQLAEVHEVVERAAAGERGALAYSDTLRAAVRGQIETLLLAPGFVAAQEDMAEELIAHAVDHRGVVELVGGEAAELLETEAGGVGARLRYARRGVAAHVTEGWRP